MTTAPVLAVVSLTINFLLHTAGGEHVGPLIYNDDRYDEDSLEYIYQTEQLLDVKPRHLSPSSPAKSHSGNSHTQLSSQDTGSSRYYNQSLVFRPGRPESVLAKSEISLTLGYSHWRDREIEEREEEEELLPLDGGPLGDDFSILSRDRRAVTQTSGDALLQFSMTISGWTLPTSRRRRKRAAVTTLAEARAAVAAQMVSLLESRITGATFQVDVTLTQNGADVDATGELTYQVEETSPSDIGKAFYYQFEAAGKNFPIGDSLFDVGSTEVQSEDGSSGDTLPSICFVCGEGYKCTNESSTDGTWYCSVGDERFYQFGKTFKDSEVARGRELASGKVLLNPSMTFGNKIYNKLWVSVNGHVSFGKDYSSFDPVELPVDDNKLVCPYWTDLDLSDKDSEGHVYYNVYSGTNPDHTGLISRASKDVLSYNTDDLTTFSATTVVVATWDQVKPYGTSSNERVTFQLVLISDGQWTFAMFLYLQGGMKLDKTLLRDVVAGWGEFNLDTRDNYYIFDEISGNTNPSQPGIWFFRIGQKVNSRGKCATWLIQEAELLLTIEVFNRLVPACPCNKFVAQGSAFWAPNYQDSDVTCYDSLPVFALYGRRCCYRNDNSSAFENRIPNAGNFQYLSPLGGLPADFHDLTDKTPKRWCCEESDLASQCEEFYKYRPVRECTDLSFVIGTGIGDPHVMTLDSRSFIFNGLGEYRLLEVNTTVNVGSQTYNVAFKMQARTCIAKNALGKDTKATVFCALALKIENGAEINVEVSSPTGTEEPYLIIYFNKDDHSARFRDQTVFEKYEKGMLIEKVDGKNILKISSSSNIGAEVTLEDGLLNIVYVVGADYRSKTKGLLGNYNDDDKDDFRDPDGNLLSNSMSEREIFAYSQKWAVTDEISIFHRQNGDTTATFSNATFEPIYFDEQSNETKQNASDICGGIANIACVFDFIATQNEKLALGSKTAVTTIEETKAVITNKAPIIFNGTDEMRVVVGGSASFNLLAQDPENGTLQYLVLNQPPAQQFSYTELNYKLMGTFSPNDTNPTKIEIAVLDDKNLQSEVKAIPIITCSNCTNQGTCDFDNPVETKFANYKVASCICEAPYSGTNCEDDKNGCATRPCPEGTTCTDIHADQELALGQAYNCSACPEGTTLNTNLTKCEDDDECKLDSACPSNSTCINNVGSYSCLCNSGFRKGKVNGKDVCNDINECMENSYTCEQICVNEVGSYSCKCNEGFSSSGALGFNCTAIPAQDPCAGLSVSCGYGCLNTSGEAQCFCPTGYSLSTTDNRTCIDDDECTFDSLCAQKCDNTEGSFTCSCYSGYKLAADLLDCKVCDSNMYGPGCTKRCDCRGRSTRCDNVRGCICNEFWTGESCNIDIDECDQEKNPCPGTQNCRNLNGSFACDCPTGYQKNSSDTDSCIDFDECVNAQDNKCPLKSICVNNPGSFSCVCESGYNYNAISNRCDDIDECAIGTSGCEQICSNSDAGSYNCECNQGYVLKADRLNCMKADKDAYKEMEEICATHDVNCSYACRVVNNTTPQCYCGFGYELSSDRQTCLDVNECQDSSLNQCADPNTCENLQGSYKCSCAVGSKLQNDERTCKVCDSYHWGENCANQCDCNPLGVDKCDPVTGCKCLSGWAGTKCYDDIDECSQSQEVCPFGSDCINSKGSYRCQCRTGFQKVTDSQGEVSCADINECDNSPCDHNCNNTIGSYICSCNDGFSVDLKDKDQCDDINECMLQTMHDCQQDCRNTQGSYVCECYDGFTLNLVNRRTCKEIQKTSCTVKNCSDTCIVTNNVEQCLCNNGFELANDNQTCVDIDECTTLAPCGSDATCVNKEPGFDCTCSVGYKLANDKLNCLVCDTGFYGDNCAQQCTCNTTNTASCATTDGTCTCVQGWEGTECSTDIDECLTDRCSNISNSACKNTDGSYKCSCNIGFFSSGSNCIACDATSFGPDCSKTCTCEQVNTADCDDVNGSCTCKVGYTGANCTDDFDECSDPNYCTGDFQTCNNLPGSAKCVCQTGYSRLNETQPCVECVATRYGQECAQSCSCVFDNTKDCNNVDGNCTCKAGWKGNNCETDIDECTEQNHQCSTNEVCANVPGSVDCDCVVGFYRPPTSSVCTECTSTTFGKDCGNTCSCVVANTVDCDNTDGSCSCKAGWEGGDCGTDTDECVNAPCTANQTCVNTDGSYLCVDAVKTYPLTIKIGLTVSNDAIFNSSSQAFTDLAKEFGDKLLNIYKSVNPAVVGVQITGFRHGSTIVEAIVSVEAANGTSTDGIMSSVVVDSSNIPIVINGTSYDPVVNYNGVTVTNSTTPCELLNCTSAQTCNNSNPECVTTPTTPPAIETYIVRSWVNITLTVAGVFDNSTQEFRDMAKQIETQLLRIYQEISSAVANVTVTNLRNGSTIIDSIVDIDLSATNDAPGVIRNISIESAHGKTFDIDGTTVVINGVSYKINGGNPVNVKCADMSCQDKQCVDEDGRGKCVDITTTPQPTTEQSTQATTVATKDSSSSSDDNDLVIGLAVGIPLFCLFTLLIAIIVYMYARQKQRSERQSSQRSIDRGAPFQSVFATGMATKGSWGVHGSRLYRPDAYSDVASSVSSGDGRLLKSQNKRGRSDFQDSPWYDNRGATPRPTESRATESHRAPTEAAGPTSNFSWEYMFQLLEPHRELQIERPRVTPRPNPMHTPRGGLQQQKRPDSMA